MRDREGYAAAVWEFGCRTEITGVRATGRSSEPFDTLDNCILRRRDRIAPGWLLVFETPEVAETAVLMWIRQRWGEAADEAVWRY